MCRLQYWTKREAIVTKKLVLGYREFKPQIKSSRAAPSVEAHHCVNSPDQEEIPEEGG